jgi:hypothetical protein
MQAAFLRLGAANRSFFNNRVHSGRCLLEAMTAKSLPAASEAYDGFVAFMQNLQVSTEQLVQNKSTQTLDFAAGLKAFEDGQAGRDQAVDGSHKLVVKALMQTKQCNLLAKKLHARSAEGVILSRKPHLCRLCRFCHRAMGTGDTQRASWRRK